MNDKLNAHIQDLHDLLDGQPVDECTAASLRQITDELEIALARAEGKVPVETFNDRLEKEAIEFAEEHPTIAQTIRQIMNTLNSIGI
ncbi:hypothetical protein GCM10023116_10410 [Kistimonas scapharcae]|uniref:DUF4404 family protein n=1 Tax=Kistimonas scapharcae TaxID=1036133 RepID=A0ABP8UXX5_9GAMM